jgi:hypothetical protein
MSLPFFSTDGRCELDPDPSETSRFYSNVTYPKDLVYQKNVHLSLLVRSLTTSMITLVHRCLSIKLITKVKLPGHSTVG